MPFARPQALGALAHAPSTHVAILSGRTLSDLALRTTSLGPIWLASDHGSVVVDPEQRRHIFDEVPDQMHLDALTERAEELSRIFRGARVEPKSRSVALHYREVPEPKHDALVEMFRLAIRTYHGSVLLGRKVIEGRFGLGDKGRALAHILDRLPPETALIYVGDDVTDEPALEFARNNPLGIALYIRSAERLSPQVRVNGWLNDTDEWLEILELFARLRTTPSS